ncbi:MAG: exonuclease SbcC [Nitrosopumilus sp.]
MVFGWGKKKEETKPAEYVKPVTKEVSLSEIPKIVEELEELRKSQLVSEIKHLRNITQPMIEDLIEIGNVLERDDLRVDDIDKHLAIIVVRGKKQVIDVIKKGVAPLPGISSVDDAIKLSSVLNQILKKIGDVLGRQTRVIHIFAKKYASHLKENLEIMNSNNSEIRKLLKNYESTKSISAEIVDTLNQIKTLNNNQLEDVKKLTGINQNLKSASEKISSIENSIKEIRSSDEHKKYLDLKSDIDSFSVQKSKIKNEIDAQFTKISRPLSRYEYGSSLDKDQKNLLAELIKDPFDVILPQNIDSIIIILENVRKGIISGSISVKDVDKSLAQITETEESLDTFEKKISGYQDKNKTMLSELQSIASKELTFFESDLAKNILVKEDLQQKLETIQGDIDEIKSSIPKLVSKIEEKLRQFSNTRYTVIPSS